MNSPAKIYESIDKLNEAFSANEELPGRENVEKLLECTENVITTLVRELNEDDEVPTGLSPIYSAGVGLATALFDEQRRNNPITGELYIFTNGPSGAFTSRMQALFKAVRETTSPQPKQHLESVTELKKLGVSDYQIAKMYAVRLGDGGLSDAEYKGPFFDDHGRMLHDLIDQQVKFEAGEEGVERVIPEGFSLDDLEDKKPDAVEADLDILLIEAIRIRRNRTHKNQNVAAVPAA